MNNSLFSYNWQYFWQHQSDWCNTTASHTLPCVVEIIASNRCCACKRISYCNLWNYCNPSHTYIIRFKLSSKLCIENQFWYDAILWSIHSMRQSVWSQYSWRRRALWMSLVNKNHIIKVDNININCTNHVTEFELSSISLIFYPLDSATY